MNLRDKTALYRVSFITVMVIAVVLLAVGTAVFYRGANFQAKFQKPSTETAASADNSINSVSEPENAYSLIRLTFGGACTPASMFGSDSYGTFNSALNSLGAEYFLDRISSITKNDDMTLVGCNAVISDSTDLTPANHYMNEWYFSGTEALDIFKSAGIDTLSLECPRTRYYGWNGIKALEASVEESGITWGNSGKAIYKTFQGINFAVFCCMLSEANSENIANWISKAEQNNDFVILYVCDGETGANVPSDTKISAFRGYIDAGADLVVGSNTSNLQYTEKYGDGFIAYSLGALLDGSTKYAEKYTALLILEVRADNGEIMEIEYDIIPCETYDSEHEWCPSVISDTDEGKSVLEFMLNSGEFPE